MNQAQSNCYLFTLNVKKTEIKKWSLNCTIKRRVEKLMIEAVNSFETFWVIFSHCELWGVQNSITLLYQQMSRKIVQESQRSRRRSLLLAIYACFNRSLRFQRPINRKTDCKAKLNRNTSWQGNKHVKELNITSGQKARERQH